VVRHLVGAPAQDLPAAGLALRARSQSVSADGVWRARTRDRSIVWTWAMRGTLHLVAAQDMGWLVPLTAQSSFTAAHRRLRQEGLSGDQAARAVRLVERVLERDGPSTRAEIGQRLAHARIRTQGQALIHVIRLAALHGLVCHGPEHEGEPTFVLVRDWITSAEPMTRDRALAELATRYLAAYGPAGPEDFAAWSGLPSTEARKGWSSIADRLTEVDTDTGPLWTLRTASPGGPIGVVRLIPGFDPYLLGWRTRDLVVPEQHRRQVFPGGGMLRSTLLVDGSAAGTWTAKRQRGRMVVAVHPFSRLDAAVRRALADEAADLGRFHKTTAELSLG
jgi:hypothetical protein